MAPFPRIPMAPRSGDWAQFVVSPPAATSYPPDHEFESLDDICVSCSYAILYVQLSPCIGASPYPPPYGFERSLVRQAITDLFPFSQALIHSGFHDIVHIYLAQDTWFFGGFGKPHD